MKKGTKVRGLIWLLLAIAGVIAAGASAYVDEQQNIVKEKVFQDKPEDQVGIEFLEIYSYKYERLPIISETREDYSFDVYRSIYQENTLSANLYVMVTDLTESADAEDPLPKIGLIDFMVYCSSEEDTYEKLVGFERLGTIAGTNTYAHFIELDSSVVKNCESGEFTLIMDSSRAEDLYGVDVLESISLSDIYDLQSVYTAALLENNVDLNDGFQGDLTKSSYNIYSWQKAFLYGGLSILLIFPIAFGLFYVTERELFENNILDRKKK
jgi:hypothetical protein